MVNPVAVHLNPPICHVSYAPPDALYQPGLSCLQCQLPPPVQKMGLWTSLPRWLGRIRAKVSLLLAYRHSGQSDLLCGPSWAGSWGGGTVMIDMYDYHVYALLLAASPWRLALIHLTGPLPDYRPAYPVLSPRLESSSAHLTGVQPKRTFLTPVSLKGITSIPTPGASDITAVTKSRSINPLI